MKIVAFRAGQYLVRDGRHFHLFDTESNRKFLHVVKDRILARGYWEPWKGTPSESKKILSKFDQ